MLLCYCFSQCPAENAGDGISETLNLKIFRGSMPQTPLGLGCLWRTNFYSPACAFKISRYAADYWYLTAYEINAAQGLKKKL